MRRAAQRVAILQAVQGRSRRIDGQVFAQPGGDLELAGVRLGGEQALIEVLRIALHGDHVHRGDARGQLEQVLGARVGQAGQAGHHRRAVHQCQGFLGTQHQRGPAQLAMHVRSTAALASEQHLALARQGGGDVRQRGQVAAGADRTFLRDQRQHVMREERLQAFEQLQTHAGNALAQRLQASGEHRTGGVRFEQLAQAAAVEGEQMPGQRLDLVQRNRHHAGVAVTGGHAVDHPFAVQQRVEELRAAGDALAERVVVLQLRGCLLASQGHHLFQAQGRGAKDYGFRICCRHAVSRRQRS